MKRSHNFAAGLIRRHERCHMKSMSKPCWFFLLLADPQTSVPYGVWFDSPVVLDLVPPCYLWHVDFKWLSWQTLPIFQSPLSGYVGQHFGGKSWSDTLIQCRTSVISDETEWQNFLWKYLEAQKAEIHHYHVWSCILDSSKSSVALIIVVRVIDAIIFRVQ